jgi:hypothetical protein
METVTLKNGSTEALPLVQTAIMSITSLWDSDPIAAFELVEVARNPEHRPFGITGKKLKNLGLLESENGGMHQSLRNIILSAAQGEGLKLWLVDPRA